MSLILYDLALHTCYMLSQVDSIKVMNNLPAWIFENIIEYQYVDAMYEVYKNHPNKLYRFIMKIIHCTSNNIEFDKLTSNEDIIDFNIIDHWNYLMNSNLVNIDMHIKLSDNVNYLYNIYIKIFKVEEKKELEYFLRIFNNFLKEDQSTS